MNATDELPLDAPTPMPTESPATSSSDAPPIITTYDPGPCPPQGGATSVRQMNSTTTAVLTDYQYWHFKQHGHATTLQ